MRNTPFRCLGKPVTGEVLEREEARQLYEQEKAAGREAGITEKNSYRTFETRISPVRARQETRLLYEPHLRPTICRLRKF